MTIDNYLQKHYTIQTAKAYRREIKIYLSNYEAAETANYKDIINYIGLLRNKYSKAATINRIVSSIKVYYDYLCSENIRNDNPTKSIQLKDTQNRAIQLQDLFTTEELELLLTIKEERYKKLEDRNKVLISLLIYQAMQPSEIAALQVNDIHLGEGIIYIKSTPKSNGRTLSLKPNQILLFKNYMEKLNNAILIPMSSEDITKHIHRSYGNAFGGRKVTCQTIRQSVITNLLKQNHDISIVQSYAGHKTPSTTEKYRQTGIETLQAAVNKYHPMK